MCVYFYTGARNQCLCAYTLYRYMHTYVYRYVEAHVCIYVYAYRYVCINSYTKRNECIYIYMYTYIYSYVYDTSIHTYIYIHMYVCKHLHLQPSGPLAPRPRPGSRVLDPVCGSGSLLLAAAALGARTVWTCLESLGWGLGILVFIHRCCNTRRVVLLIVGCC